MTRPDRFAVADLDDEQRALYDRITGGPRASGPQAFRLTDDEGRLEGPFDAMLASPRLGGALQAVGTELRYGSALSDRAREIAILVVAHHWRSAFEIHAHEAVGTAVGLTEDELAALRDGRPDGFTEPGERLVATTVRALVTRGDLDDAEYAAATGLGARVLFELTTVVGYYATLALQLRVYRVGLPAGGTGPGP